ncbi:ribosome biogenesis GTPase YlqF [Desulfofundulus thermobenzoicus]|uniref:Ribosome biogenesis GTPase A n=2 Tax=Desulfofundulus thermobenzoicus TaxID=29376 RepID=A0A6N7IRR2_9FIRM|nr:ribosome biogenesis GTPase YlqF [Desulfofundulus thermobenzoicus]
MARARRLLRENLKLVDVVIELLDARIPVSSRNPQIAAILGHMPRLVVLNKADLADGAVTLRWLEWFSIRGTPAIAVDSTTGKGLGEVPLLVEELSNGKIQALVSRGRRPRSPRCMVVGIPNVGKSLFINALVGRRVTRTGNRPGVTRGQQWIRLARGVELLDTPGVLWPKFDDRQIALKLAVTGAIKEEVFDVEDVAAWLVGWLKEHCPRPLMERYRLEEVPAHGRQVLELIARRRGLLGAGGVPDTGRAAIHLLKEFRAGKLGRVTLDEPCG